MIFSKDDIFEKKEELDGNFTDKNDIDIDIILIRV